MLLLGSFYNLTLSWLIKHHFPPGPIHLTRTHVPTLPVYISVGNFKVQYMESLQRKGFELYAAYGNTGTDVRAYEAAGIPKERCVDVDQAVGSHSRLISVNTALMCMLLLCVSESLSSHCQTNYLHTWNACCVRMKPDWSNST